MLILTFCVINFMKNFVKSISQKNFMKLISWKKFQLIVELSDRHTVEVHALMCDGGVVACVLGNSTSWWFLYSKKSREGRGMAEESQFKWRMTWFQENLKGSLDCFQNELLNVWWGLGTFCCKYNVCLLFVILYNCGMKFLI